MATVNQLAFIALNRDLILEPILIIGSKMHDYDKEDITARLVEWGFAQVIGIDLCAGDRVDALVDITDSNSPFIRMHHEAFATVICMEVLTNVRNPFMAATNAAAMLRPGGTAILSECIVRKISRMPVDFWRFTYDGTKELFSPLSFDDERARVSRTREKAISLLPLTYPLPELLLAKHEDENTIGYWLRRVHRRFFARGVFRLSRLMPETTIYSVARKK